MWNFFGVVVFHISLVNWGGGTSVLGIYAFCYMWNLFGVVVIHRSMINWRRGSLVYVHCYLWNFFGVAVFHISMINWRRYICPQYMWIVLYINHMWCSGIPYIYGQLEWQAFCCIWNVFSVVVFHRSIVNWRRGAWYMCMLLSVKLCWWSSISYMYDQLAEISVLSKCALCYMWNIFGVVVLHRSIVNWRRWVFGTCALCY